MQPLFDTHAHLQDEAFDEDREALIASLPAAGIARVVLPASSLEDSEKLCELALRHPFLYALVGVHPHEASEWKKESAERLKFLIGKTNARGREQGRETVVVGIGEIGLDYHYDFSPRERQKEAFRSQLALAHELSLPVVIHEREAFQDAYEILKEAADDRQLQDRLAIHCYSGSAESAALLLKLGECYFGFDGPITFKNAKKPLEALAAIPPDRLLLETDSPYLTPVPFRGRRNDPSKLPCILKKAAETLSLPEEELAAQLWKNSCRFFRLPEV